MTVFVIIVKRKRIMINKLSSHDIETLNIIWSAIFIYYILNYSFFFLWLNETANADIYHCLHVLAVPDYVFMFILHARINLIWDNKHLYKIEEKKTIKIWNRFNLKYTLKNIKIWIPTKRLILINSNGILLNIVGFNWIWLSQSW